MTSKIEIQTELLAELQRLADHKREPLEKIVENAIRWALSNRRELDPLFANYEPYDGSTPSDLAQNHDDYLYGDKQ